MTEGFGVDRDLGALVVQRVGAVVVSDDLWEPVRLTDAAGEVVRPVAAFLNDLQAAGRSTATQRSYAMDLLRWFRFCWAVDVAWDHATRVEARDFCRWLTLRDKPKRGTASASRRRAGTPNAVTGKPSAATSYAAATRAHSETVLRVFYNFHGDAGSGPMVNPFPLSRERRDRRAHAHHNSMEPFHGERTGLYRPRVARRIPRCIPDDLFDRLFAELGSHRDRALVALWVSTGARAAELLGARCGDVDPGQQLISVVRKGSRAVQPLPASPDAFVWLRLYQATMAEAPAGPDDPLWLTLRRPLRPLTYHAARAMFARVGEALGANWTLHDLRHTAAYRMVRDPLLPLTDVQWVLGHAHLSTTQIYLTPLPADVITAVLAHHRRSDTTTEQPPTAVRGYRSESLDVLFAGRPE
jgi:integrase